MDRIMVYHEQNGKITVRIPKGTIPDRETLEKVAQAIAEHRKSPAPCGNMEQGSRRQAVSYAQIDFTTSANTSQDGGHKNG